MRMNKWISLVTLNRKRLLVILIILSIVILGVIALCGFFATESGKFIIPVIPECISRLSRPCSYYCKILLQVAFTAIVQTSYYLCDDIRLVSCDDIRLDLCDDIRLVLCDDIRLGSLNFHFVRCLFMLTKVLGII